MNSRFYVYVMYRENGEPFYVGKGTRRRWQNFEARNPHCQSIIDKIMILGEELIVRKVAIFETSLEAIEFEKELIKNIGRKVRGGPLSNMTDGGEGGLGGYVLSEISRKKISNALKGKTRTPEQRARMSTICRGRIRSPEAVEKAAAKIRGRKLSSEHKQKISLAKLGKPLSYTHIEGLRGKKRSAVGRMNISLSLKGRRLTESHKASLRGKRHSLETLAKMRATKLGKGKSPEIRANMRAGWVKRKAHLYAFG